MSEKIIQRRHLFCDAPRCEEKVLGATDNELEGWAFVTIRVPNRAVATHERHLCPRHARELCAIFGV